MSCWGKSGAEDEGQAVSEDAGDSGAGGLGCTQHGHCFPCPVWRDLSQAPGVGLGEEASLLRCVHVGRQGPPADVVSSVTAWTSEHVPPALLIAGRSSSAGRPGHCHRLSSILGPNPLMPPLRPQNVPRCPQTTRSVPWRQSQSWGDLLGWISLKVIPGVSVVGSGRVLSREQLPGRHSFGI